MGQAIVGQRARILIVDDEAALTSTLSAVLRSDHDVIATTEPAEALALFRAGERFDLILCDVSMPGVTGADVHAYLAVSRPDLLPRVVYMTGGAFTPRLCAFLDSVPNPKLEKPFAVTAIDDLLRALPKT